MFFVFVVFESLGESLLLQFRFKSIKYLKSVLCFMFLSCVCQADQLDELLVRDPTLDQVVRAIAANGEYRVSTLISFKRRALHFFTSSVDYLAILNDGLKATDESYKKATSDLLVETFPAFLTSRPSPSLNRVLELIQPNGSLVLAQLISLKRMALQAFPTYTGYASILRDGLKHGNQNYRAATVQLLSDQWESYLETKPSTQELLKLIRYGNSEFHVPFFTMTRDFILEEYKILLDQRLPLSTVLAFIAPNGHYTLDFLLTLKKMAFLYYTSHDDYLQIIGDGMNHPNERYRRECMKLENLQTLKFLETNPSTSEVLKNLRYFSKLAIVGSPSQDAYEAYLNGVTLDRLRDDLQNYSSQGAIPDSTASKSAGLSRTEEDSKSCPICYGAEAEATGVEIHPCHHKVCSACLTKYLQGRIADNAYPILCPLSNCKTLFGKAELAEIDLSEIERMKWERHALHEEVRQIPGAVFCSTADCPDAFIPSVPGPSVPGPSVPGPSVPGPSVPGKRKNIFKNIFKSISKSCSERTVARLFSKSETPDFHQKCRTCESNQCLKCGRTHVNLSCKDLIKLEKASEDVISRGIRSRIYKHCPKCQSIIEKNNGCDHMTCRKCKYEFYWSNLRPYS